MAQILFTLQSLFSLWMVVDCYQKRRERYWYFIIMIPFGEWFYFFKYKLHDPEFKWLKDMVGGGAPKRDVSVDALRYDYETTPSFTNRVALAQALHDNDEYAEALEHFTATYAQDDESRESMLGLGLCHIALGQHATAVDPLRALTRRHAAYEDWMAWSLLAESLWESDQRDACFELLDTLIIKSPRLPNRLMQAQFLYQAGRVADARQALEAGLKEHNFAPDFQKRNERESVKAAEEMLAGLP